MLIVGGTAKNVTFVCSHIFLGEINSNNAHVNSDRWIVVLTSRSYFSICVKLAVISLRRILTRSSVKLLSWYEGEGRSDDDSNEPSQLLKFRLHKTMNYHITSYGEGSFSFMLLSSYHHERDKDNSLNKNAAI